MYFYPCKMEKKRKILTQVFAACQRLIFPDTNEKEGVRERERERERGEREGRREGGREGHCIC